MVNDTSPQLGGDLDLNGSIIGVGDGGPNANQEHIRFGNDGDLRIYHDGSDSYINDTGTGHLNITSSQVNILNPAANEAIAKFIPDGAVELYHDNTKKFETYANGCTVTGNLNASNVDLGDSAKARFGGSNDLEIYHDGTNNVILGSTGDLYQKSADDMYFRVAGDESGINIIGDGAVELYYDNSKKLATTSSGVQISHTGDCQLQLLADSDNNGSNQWPHIQFRVDNTSGQAEAQIAYRQDNSVLKIDIAGTEKVGVNANGLVFNGDTAAANALNDYEEGTWTPALYNGTGITVHSASYTKVGNLCNVSAYVTISSNSSSGMVKFNSLPFTAANVGYSIGSAYTQSTGGTHVFSQIDSNSTNIIIYKTNGGTVYQSELSGDYALFSGTYRTT